MSGDNLQLDINGYLIGRGLNPASVADPEDALKRWIALGCKQAEDLLRKLNEKERGE